jgi:hypothetical protein
MYMFAVGTKASLCLPPRFFAPDDHASDESTFSAAKHAGPCAVGCFGHRWSLLHAIFVQCKEQRARLATMPPVSGLADHFKLELELLLRAKVSDKRETNRSGYIHFVARKVQMTDLNTHKANEAGERISTNDIW